MNMARPDWPRRRALILFVMVSWGLGVAGCSSGPASGDRPSAAAASEPNWPGRERVQSAIAMLNRGEADRARRQLMAALRRDPADGIARQLLSQIDGDPRQMLGTESYSYALRDGETLSTVAQRALGNPMMFWILARYNNIAVPEGVTPGQIIQVPGRRPAPPVQRRPAPSAPPRANPPSTAPAPARPAPARQAVNPALAARLRSQGLAALNAGAVDRAVASLRQALAADPGNATIRADLERALRVQRTVRARR